MVTLVRERPSSAEGDAGGDAPTEGPICPETRLLGTTSVVASPGPVWLETEALGRRRETRFTLGPAPTVEVTLLPSPATPIGEAELVEVTISAPAASNSPFTVSTLPPVPTTQPRTTLLEGGAGVFFLAIPSEIGEVRISVGVAGTSTTTVLRRTP